MMSPGSTYLSPGVDNGMKASHKMMNESPAKQIRCGAPFSMPIF
jgi:hypothetical protein